MPAEKKAKKHKRLKGYEGAKSPTSIVLLCSVLVLILASCATAPLQDVYTRDAFIKGDVVLPCNSFACANSWRSRRSELAKLYKSRAWDQLVTQVSNLQYDHDMAYFYLGRAAQELGAQNAAKKYFERVRSASSRCSEGLLNGCSGILIEEEISEQSQRIADQLAAISSKPMPLSEVQARLNELGLYTAAIDGISGPRTTAAVQQFQSSRGLPETGAINPETMLALANTTRAPEVVPVRVAKTVVKKPQQPTVADAELVADNAPIPAAEVSEGSPVEVRTETPVELLVDTAADSPQVESASIAADAPAEALVEEPAEIPVVEMATEMPVEISLEEPEEVAVSDAPTGVMPDEVALDAPEAPVSQALEAPVEAVRKPLATSAPAVVATTGVEPASGTAAIPGAVAALPDSTGMPEIAVEPAATAEAASKSSERTKVIVEIELLTAADPFAEVVTVLQQGSWVTIIDRGAEWSKISHENKIGYVYTDNLQ